MSEPAKVIDIDREREEVPEGWIRDKDGRLRPANWPDKSDPSRAAARERLADNTAGSVTYRREYKEWL